MIKLNEVLDISNFQKKNEKKNEIKILDDILEEIKNANKIIILTHESPDGDAIGSILAMNLIIQNLGKKADMVMSEFPRLFKFLPNSDKIKKCSDNEFYDLAISVDCADFKRLDNNEYFEKATKTIVIDHHGSNKMYGDLNFVNPVSPACCEVLVEILQYYNMKIEKYSADYISNF